MSEKEIVLLVSICALVTMFHFMMAYHEVMRTERYGGKPISEKWTFKERATYIIKTSLIPYYAIKWIGISIFYTIKHLGIIISHVLIFPYYLFQIIRDVVKWMRKGERSPSNQKQRL